MPGSGLTEVHRAALDDRPEALLLRRLRVSTERWVHILYRKGPCSPPTAPRRKALVQIVKLIGMRRSPSIAVMASKAPQAARESTTGHIRRARVPKRR